MKNVRILTYWGVPNYGAWTQAYALNNIISYLLEENGEPYDCKHINYLENLIGKYIIKMIESYIIILYIVGILFRIQRYIRRKI